MNLKTIFQGLTILCVFPYFAQAAESERCLNCKNSISIYHFCISNCPSDRTDEDTPDAESTACRETCTGVGCIKKGECTQEELTRIDHEYFDQFMAKKFD